MLADTSRHPEPQARRTRSVSLLLRGEAFVEGVLGQYDHALVVQALRTVQWVWVSRGRRGSQWAATLACRKLFCYSYSGCRCCCHLPCMLQARCTMPVWRPELQ